ncbi:caspase family protein [Desulfobacterales bacterium HSG16]|nr:caspase family protein [Desulfobacterales bacterium HSG16]
MKPKFVIFTLLLSLFLFSAITAVSASQPPILVLDPGGHKALIWDVAFTPDGRYLLSAGDDKAVRVWDIETGKTVRFIRGQTGEGNEGQIFAMALSPDGGMVAVGGYLANDSDPIRLHDTRTGQVLGILKGHTNAILSLAFSPDGKYLASGDGASPPTVRIWNVRQKRQIHVLKGHTKQIYALAFSPDGKRLVSGSYDHTLLLWDVRSGGQLAKITGHTDKVKSAAWSPRGGYIASGSHDHTIRLWDGKTGKFIKTLADQGTQVGSLTFSPDGKKLLSGVSMNRGPFYCHVFSVPDGRELVTFREHDNIVLATAISPDGRLAATGGGNNQDLLIWDLSTGKVKKRLSGKGASVWAVGFAKDGESVAWGQTWEKSSPLIKGHLTQTLSLRAGRDFHLSMSGSVSDESAFVRATDKYGPYRLAHARGGDYGYNDAILKLLKNGNETSRKERSSTNGYRHRCYTFTPDGKFVVSGGGNGFLTLYALPNLEHTADFIGHEGDLWAVAVSPDGRYLVSGADDQTLRIWNLEQAKKGGSVQPLVSVFPAKDGSEWAAWTPEGYFTGSENAGRIVGFQINKGIDHAPEFISSEQLSPVFFKPGIVGDKLAGRSVSSLPDITTFLAKARTPLVRIISPRDGSRISGDTVNLRYAVTDTGGGIGTVRIYLNGTAVETGGRRGIMRKKGRKEDVREMTLSLQAGRHNIIGIVAYDGRDEIKTEEMQVRVFSRADIRRPDFHALVVGINEFGNPSIELSYARPDAEAIADVLRKKTKSSGLFKNVNVKLLTDQNASLANIRAAFAALQDKRNVKPEDVVTLYIASHGEVRDKRYFLLTSDVEYLMTEDMEKTCMLGEELRDSFAEIPASKKLLILDACKAAQLIMAMNRGMAESTTIEQLARAVGSYVMAAATEVQYASEGYRGHGLFTYVLLEGLKGAADYDNSGVVEVDELKIYVKKEVPRLSLKIFKRKQLPVAYGKGESFPLVRP